MKTIQERFFLAGIPRDGEGGGGGGQGGGQTGGDPGGGGGGGAAKPWYEGIDQETVGHWDNKGWKKDDPKALATELTKAWKGLEKHFGVPPDQLLKLPKDNNDAEGIKAMRARIGVPDDGKGYDFTNVKRADGSDLDPALADTLRGVLHKAGVTKDAAPEAVKALVKHFDDRGAAGNAEQAARLQADRAALLKEWGTNAEFNRLTAMQGARRAAGDDAGATKLIDAMEGAIGYKATMEFFRKIGAGTSEDTFVDRGTGGMPVTASGATARISELMADADWSKRYLAGGAAERCEMDNLLALKSGAAA